MCVCVCVCVHLSHSLVGRNAGGLGVSDRVRRPGRKLVLAHFRFVLSTFNIIFTFHVAASHSPNSDNGALEAGLTGNTPLLHSVESTHETERSDIKNVLSIDFQEKDEIFLCRTDKNTSALYVGFSSSP